MRTALDALMRDRTTVIIAHRLATCATPTGSRYLDRGRLIETGTHIELLARGGPVPPI